MSNDDLRDIVTRASWLWERISLRPTPAPLEADGPLAAARMAAWSEAVGGVETNDPSALERRLRWAGVDPERARAALGRFVLPTDAALPAWAATLDEIRREARRMSAPAEEPREPSDPRDEARPIPFESLFMPAIHVARRRLESALARGPAKDAASVFSTEARRALERSLLVALAELCELSLYEMFSEVRPPGELLLATAGVLDPADASRATYDAFVADLLAHGLGDLFGRFPVLARLMCVTITHWATATTELMVRTAEDRAAIAERFGASPAAQLGQVKALETSISDSHNEGRSVAVLTFQSGLRVVYKPRPLAVDLAFGSLLAWCNRRSGKADFKIVDVLDRGIYGWTEFIPQLPCDDEAAAQRFYRRAGQLTCLLYALRVSDCHHENLVACGEHLVLIDMETLLHATPHSLDRPQDDLREEPTTATSTFWESCIRTGMLPRWSFSSDMRLATDDSALGGVHAERHVKRAEWALPNTDGMHPRQVEAVEPAGHNAPRIGDQVLSPDDFVGAIVEGFESFYAFLLEHRTALLEESPLLLLRDQEVRFVFRATRTYVAVLKRLREPAFLGDGVDFSIELDQLSRPFAVSEQRPNAWPILDAELRAMEQLDVPLFLASTSSADLAVPGAAPSRGYLLEASYDAVVRQLRALSETDRARQVAVITGSFVARAADPRAASATATPHRPAGEHRTPIDPLAAALRLAGELTQRSMPDDDDSVSWLGFAYVASANRFQLQVLGDRLYDGRLGVALFFGALARVTGDPSFAAQALRCIRGVRKWIHDPKLSWRPRVAQLMGVGAASGLGGVIYTLVILGELLNEPSLVEDAGEVARLLPKAAITADLEYDIFSGAAGTILGLERLLRAAPDPALIGQIADCADHLLERRVAQAEGGAAWQSPGFAALTGMSHGAAGISLALARAYQVTGDVRYRDAALEGIAFEARHYSPEARNWPDYRGGGPKGPYLVQWCHGAPGIALARIATRAILEGAALDADIEAALRTTLEHPLPAQDHLCCGSMGLVETLLVGEQHGHGEHLGVAAREKAQRVLARAATDGGHRLFANLPTSVFNPTFFSGTAGIGYQLLRLVSKEIPSVLAWA
ncbi:MAG TPA: type 2 lanthipeptide synthetase LanM family protein [Labilithrix sp.]|nr:type 2 lanthipeptide synthetase LanM family protein [Labilithrix sp.]